MENITEEQLQLERDFYHTVINSRLLAIDEIMNKIVSHKEITITEEDIKKWKFLVDNKHKLINAE